MEGRNQAQGIQISGSLIARNTLINLIGQALPLLVAVIAMPFVIRGLGTERFGLLSLAWMVMGYFTIFDLGLGRATTKYVAEALAKGKGGRASQIIWTAVTVQAIMGLVALIILFWTTDFLVERVLNIPVEIVDEAKTTFIPLAFSIPVVLLSSCLSGVLEAAQRFDLVNAVRMPSSILTYLLPIAGLSLGLGLPGIVIIILLARIVALVALAKMNLFILPELKEYSASFDMLPRLFYFGSWITLSSVVSPILVYLDRFLIGSLLTIAALAYYTAPYETVTRLWIIPASLTMTLFPAFSALEDFKDRQKLGIIIASSIKYILMSTGPIVALIGLFAEEILDIWLGYDFAAESTVTMQVLVIGVLINSLAQMPFALLQGIGRPDIPAKLQLIELPIYIVMAWILVTEFGIAGAAIAWTLRVSLDALLLFGAVFKVCHFSPSPLAEKGISHAVLWLLMLTSIGYALNIITYALPLPVQSLLFIGLFISFAIFAWKYVFDDFDRRALKAANPRRKLEST